MVGRLALRLLRSDLRSTELRLLALALAVGVAAVTTVGFFTTRIDRALEIYAAEMLGADLGLHHSERLPESFAREARRRGLEVTRTVEFRSVVLRGDAPQLVEVKAVADGYPLRGALQTAPSPGEPGVETHRLPSPGSVWVDPPLAAGGAAALELGSRRFAIEQVITWEPDRGGDLFRLAPRVLLRLADLDATGLVGPASRVRHRLLVAGEPVAISGFRGWIESRMPDGAGLVDLENVRPELRIALERGGRFLGLAALAAVLVATAGIALAARRFAERQLDTAALLRCFGARSHLIGQVQLVRIGTIGLVATLVGALFGYLGHFVLAALIGHLFTGRLPPPGLVPLWIGIGSGLALLAAVALQPLMRVRRISPLRVLRRDLGASPPAAWGAVAGGFAALAGLVLWQARDVQLALWIFGAATALVVLLYLLARLLLRLAVPLRRRLAGVWRYALATLVRQPGLAAVQLAGFGLGMLALLLLTLVRTDLLEAWSLSIPPDAPNRFLINIQPDEVAPMAAFLRAQGLGRVALFPMARARLARINDHEIRGEDYPEGRARRLATREFNLSWSDQPAPDNRIVAGRWWRDSERSEPLFSVESGIAETLGIALGDRLEFLIAGESVTGRVASLREVHWDSFNPNFFVIGTPGWLGEQPATFIASFHLEPSQPAIERRLVERFPGVTVLDVSAILRQMRGVMERGAGAVQYVFVFTLLAGVVVLYAAIHADQEQRLREAAVLRTLGLRRRDWLRINLIQFGLLGALAGGLAALCASLAGWAVTERLFGLDYQLNPWLWLFALIGGGVGVGLAALPAAAALLRVSPMRALRSE